MPQPARRIVGAVGVASSGIAVSVALPTFCTWIVCTPSDTRTPLQPSAIFTGTVLPNLKARFGLGRPTARRVGAANRRVEAREAGRHTGLGATDPGAAVGERRRQRHLQPVEAAQPGGVVVIDDNCLRCRRSCPSEDGLGSVWS